jgi:hypothetical protein
VNPGLRWLGSIDCYIDHRVIHRSPTSYHQAAGSRLDQILSLHAFIRQSIRVLSVTSLDLSYALPAHLFRHRVRSPMGRGALQR